MELYVFNSVALQKHSDSYFYCIDKYIIINYNLKTYSFSGLYKCYSVNGKYNTNF